MEITPRAMEIEYIRIKRFNLEREKAYATGTDAIHCCLIPMAGYYFFSVSSSFGPHAAERLNRLKSHVNPFCMQKMYILNLKKGMNRKIRSSSR